MTYGHQSAAISKGKVALCVLAAVITGAEGIFPRAEGISHTHQQAFSLNANSGSGSVG